MAHGLGGFFLIFSDFSLLDKIFFIEITPILKLKSVKIRRIHPIRVPFTKVAKVVFFKLNFKDFLKPLVEVSTKI